MSVLSQQNRMSQFESVQREFDHMLNQLIGAPVTANGASPVLAPYAVDVREDADNFYVEAELPGFRKEEIEITLENQQLTITAERKQVTEGPDVKKGELVHHERRYNRFVRTFTVPPTVDGNSVDAKLADGVLTLTLKKREDTKPRKITVA